MNIETIEFDVTLNCNFSCMNCNRHSNFNSIKDPFDGDNSAGLEYYDNTNVSLEQVDKLIEDCNNNKTIKRIHVIGGEPLTHPHIDKIIDRLRNNLWGVSVPNIVIISNIHPKMLKAGILDTPEQFLKFFPFSRIENLNLKYSEQFYELLKYLKANINPFNIDDIIHNIDNIKLSVDNNVNSLKNILSNMRSFRGIPISNFTPLSEKNEVHRCTLVAPYDSGQEMLPTCTIPNRCGVNYSFDGYWPCSNGSAIARLFKLDKYNMKTLPKSFSEIEGIDENGSAIIDKNSGMWDICKLCQVAAKNPMAEKEHGRPVSISYRKAMGLESSNDSKSKYVIDSHAKKLANVSVKPEIS